MIGSTGWRQKAFIFTIGFADLITDRADELPGEKGFYTAAIAVTHLCSIMKKLLCLLFVSCLTVSCNNETSLKVSEAGDNYEIIHLSFDDFKSNPEDYYGRYVKLIGMCVRVDKRGGSTMYMIGQDPCFEIKVAAGEDVVQFTRYFEGRVMEVRGYVRHDDHIQTLTRSKASNDEYKNSCGNAKPNYYIEGNQYRRSRNEG